MFEIEPPRSNEEIASALVRQSEEIGVWLEALPDDVWETPQGKHWSPSGHVRHLAKSVRAVAKGMEQPKLALRLFGRSRVHRSFDEIREIYHQALADGGQAGRYGPSAAEPSRDEVMKGWRDANARLARALDRWTPSALDRYRMPHPLLGKMSVREMLFFTLYHNAHHARRVVERIHD